MKSFHDNHNKLQATRELQRPGSCQQSEEGSTKDDLTGNATSDTGGKLKDREKLITLPIHVRTHHSNSPSTVSIDSADLSEGKVCDNYGGSKPHRSLVGSKGTVYGPGRGGGISFLGSWALGTNNCEETMMSEEGISNGRGGGLEDNLLRTGNGHRNERHKLPGRWYFEAGTLFEIRASHLLQIFCIMMGVIVLVSLIFHSRIKSLEHQKSALVHEISLMRLSLDRAVERMEAIESHAIPLRSERKFLETREENERILVKRSAETFPTTASRTTKELQYSSATMSHNMLNNGSASFNPSGNVDWSESDSMTAQPEVKGKKIRNTSRNKYFRRIVRKELSNFKLANRLELSKLKQRVRQLQNYTFSCTCCHNQSTSSSSHKLSMPSSGSSLSTKPRAAYLEIDGTSVNIRKSRQLIGPWYLPESGKDIGFNDLWYNNLALDSNGTSVIFYEDGLYLIYAQIFYQLQHVHDAKPTPMGYRIHLRKGAKGTKKGRTRTIAECLPSFPTTFYQTCFTQVAWFVEATDEVYLEHFTDSLPMIEAVKDGQTFLGIVRLSN